MSPHAYFLQQTTATTVIYMNAYNKTLFLILGLILAISISPITSEETKKMSDFTGVYEFDHDDGKFDDFLKAMDVSFITRKVAVNLSPTIEVSLKDDGTYVLSTKTNFKNSQIEFKLGQEFDEKRMDGQTVKTVITRVGNKLVQKQNATPPVEIEREFTDDKLITTCKCGDVTNVRVYKKVK